LFTNNTWKAWEEGLGGRLQAMLLVDVRDIERARDFRTVDERESSVPWSSIAL
jgi:hypothetical protein